MEMWFDLTDQMTVMGVTWTKENHMLSSFPSEQTRISSLERHLRKLADSVGKFCCCNPALVALKVIFAFHITRHRHQVLLGQVFILLGRLFRSVFLGKNYRQFAVLPHLLICLSYWEAMCVCTLLITCSLNIDLAGECGMIVGPHSTKLPQSWDTGSDQPSVPASEDSNRLSWEPETK